MATNHAIRWKRGDFIKLGRAVASYNSKIRDLQDEIGEYLPNFITYEELKNNIKTRKELNYQINSLKRFQKEGAERLYETEAGELMTVWERRNYQVLSRRAIKSLNEELDLLKKPINAGGFSRVEMGSVRANEIEAQIKYIQSFEKRKGYQLKLLMENVKKKGSYDYLYNSSLTYRKNFMEKALKSLSNFEGYDELVNYLNSIKSPIEFFKLISETPVFNDLFEWYPPNSHIYGGFSNNEEAFQYGIHEIENKTGKKILGKKDKKSK